MTIREQIVRALIAALSAEGAPAPVFRSLSKALDSDDLPAIVVRTKSEDREVVGHEEDEGRPQKSKRLIIDVICVLGATDVEGAVDEKADPLTEWIENVLELNGQMGGAFDLDTPHAEWVYEAGEQDFVGVVYEISAEYLTPPSRVIE